LGLPSICGNCITTAGSPLDVPCLCGIWSLKEIHVQNNPKHIASFILGDFKKATPKIVGKQKGFEISINCNYL